MIAVELIIADISANVAAAIAIANVPAVSRVLGDRGALWDQWGRKVLRANVVERVQPVQEVLRVSKGKTVRRALKVRKVREVPRVSKGKTARKVLEANVVRWVQLAHGISTKAAKN